jgi:hypothetical protein
VLRSARRRSWDLGLIDGGQIRMDRRTENKVHLWPSTRHQIQSRRMLSWPRPWRVPAGTLGPRPRPRDDRDIGCVYGLKTSSTAFDLANASFNSAFVPDTGRNLVADRDFQIATTDRVHNLLQRSVTEDRCEDQFRPRTVACGGLTRTSTGTWRHSLRLRTCRRICRP